MGVIPIHLFISVIVAYRSTKWQSAYVRWTQANQPKSTQTITHGQQFNYKYVHSNKIQPIFAQSTIQVDSSEGRRHCYKSRGFKSHWRSCIFSWKRFQIFQNTIDFVTKVVIKVGLWLRLVDSIGPQPHKSWQSTTASYEFYLDLKALEVQLSDITTFTPPSPLIGCSLICGPSCLF